MTMRYFRSTFFVIFAVVFLGLGRANADAIVYSVYGGYSGQNYAIIPDLNQRTKTAFDTASGSAYNSFVQYNGSNQTFDTTYNFQIRYFPSGAPAYYDVSNDAGIAALGISAHVTGFLNFRNGPSVSPNYQVEGGFTASISSVSVDPQAIAANIPAPLLALLSHPERIHLTSPDSNGSFGFLPAVYLEIDAPSPVPEPATVAFFGIAFGGIVVLRRQWHW